MNAPARYKPASTIPPERLAASPAPRQRSITARRPIVLAILALVAAATLAGCGATSTGPLSPPVSKGLSAGGAARPGTYSATGTAGLSTTGGTSELGKLGTPAGQQIARSVNASFLVERGTFGGAFTAITSRAASLGGWVVSSSTSSVNGNESPDQGVITVQVPAASLATFISGLPSSLRATSIDYSTTNDTTPEISLSAQIATLQSEQTALQKLLASASSISTMLEIQQQLQGVEANLQSDQAQLATLQQQVSYSTATLSVATPQAQVTPPSPVFQGLSSGWTNAVALLGGLIEVIVTLLPLLILAGLGLLGYLWRRKSIQDRQRNTSTTTPD